ncbi:MAG TPA: metallophosphoesterase family protein [Pirellulaceae bacterium]|jgi:hypothetical protein|nr:metallophosphoesterase family protein [Pirellulaceae bacterium]
MPANRRDFLTAFGAFAAAGSFGWHSASPSTAYAADEKEQEDDRGDDGPASLFLTWQGDPTTSVVVQWVGEEDENAEVRFGVRKKSFDGSARAKIKPFPGTDLKVHRCELTGLAPGEEYEFTLGKTGPKHRFRTMPAKANDVIHFVSGGDAGTGSAALENNRLAAKQEPYFALIGGDLAYDNGASPKTFLKFLENYGTTMIDPEGRCIPMLSCLGNHEVQGGYGATRDKGASYFSVFDGFYSDTTYGVFDVGDYLSLVLLDTNHVTPVAGEQTDWLEKTLSDRQDRPHLIVANHVPAYPSHRDFEKAGADNRKHWSPLFERYDVDVVLEHHDHTYKRTHPMKDGMVDANGVLYLGDGSWGKIRPVTSPEKRPYLARASEAYHIAVHRLEGDRRFHVALEETGKVADVCMTAGKRPAKRG